MFAKKIAAGEQVIVGDLNDTYLEDLTSFLNSEFDIGDQIDELKQKLDIFKEFLFREELFDFYNKLSVARNYGEFNRKQNQYYYLFEQFIKIEQKIVELVLVSPKNLSLAVSIASNIINETPAEKLKNYVMTEVDLCKYDHKRAQTLREYSALIQKYSFNYHDDLLEMIVAETGAVFVELSWVINKCLSLSEEAISAWMNRSLVFDSANIQKFMFVIVGIFPKDPPKAIQVYRKLVQANPKDWYREEFIARYGKYELVKMFLAKVEVL